MSGNRPWSLDDLLTLLGRVLFLNVCGFLYFPSPLEIYYKCPDSERSQVYSLTPAKLPIVMVCYFNSPIWNIVQLETSDLQLISRPCTSKGKGSNADGVKENPTIRGLGDDLHLSFTLHIPVVVR